MIANNNNLQKSAFRLNLFTPERLGNSQKSRRLDFLNEN